MCTLCTQRTPRRLIIHGCTGPAQDQDARRLGGNSCRWPHGVVPDPRKRPGGTPQMSMSKRGQAATDCRRKRGAKQLAGKTGGRERGAGGRERAAGSGLTTETRRAQRVKGRRWQLAVVSSQLAGRKSGAGGRKPETGCRGFVIGIWTIGFPAQPADGGSREGAKTRRRMRGSRQFPVGSCQAENR